MIRREELAWSRGYAAVREKGLTGYAAAIENAEIAADGSVSSVRGAAVLREIPGKNLVHGDRFVSRSGVKADILIADDGTVYREDGGASAPSIGTIAAAPAYSSDQLGDRLYIATGAAPAVVAAAGSAAELIAGPAGLPTPPAPTLAFTPFAEPANPTEALTRLATLRGRAEIYGVGSGSNFYRYRITNNDWPAAPPLPVARNTYPILGDAAGDSVVYYPGTSNPPLTFPFHDQTPNGKRTYWYDAASSSWTANLPLVDAAAQFVPSDWYWSPASSITAHGIDTMAVLYNLIDSGLWPCLAKLVKNVGGGRTDVYFATGGTPSFLGNFQIGASTIVSTGTSVYGYARGTNGIDRFFRWDGGTSITYLSTIAGFILTLGDRLVWDADRPGFIYLFRLGSSTYWEYNISTGVWSTLSWTRTPQTATAGGDPANNLLYFFASGNDFTADVLPGMPAGGLGTYKYRISWVNNAGRSNPSAIAQIDNVPDGATITVSLPAADPAALETHIYRNPSRLDTADGSMGFLDLVDHTVSGYGPQNYLDTAEVKAVIPPVPGGSSGASSMPQAKYVVVHDGRTWWLNLVDGSSDAMHSAADEPETFDPNWRYAFNPNDGDEITGGASIPGALLVFKRRSVYAFIGDPGEPPGIPPEGFIRKVAEGVGCVAPRSIAVYGGRAFFVAADGVYAADAGGAVRISDAIEDDVASTGAEVGFIDDRGRYHICLDGAGFRVFEPEAGRWEGRMTFEAHRTAAVVAGYAAADAGRRVAVAGARAIRFAEAGQPADAADPFRLKIGPHGGVVFEDDAAALAAYVRYRGAVSLIWGTDTSTAPEAARTIALPPAAATRTERVPLPTACYGRRMFFEARATVGDAAVEGISIDVVRLGWEAGAP